MREVEVKYRVTDAHALDRALKAAGVELSGPVVQDDQAYAPKGWVYGDSKAGVAFARLRTVDGLTQFTVKRPRENALSVDEYETLVADRGQMHQAILAMGYRATTRIVKSRRTGHLAGVSICVDEVDRLGLFVEVERIVTDETPGDTVQAQLDDLARSWGVPLQRTSSTYDSLIHDHDHEAAAV